MKSKIFLGMFLAAILALGSGCALFVVGAAAGAGAGTYAYVDGELKSTETVSYDTACTATLAGLKDLGFAVVDDKKDALSDKITARSTAEQESLCDLDQAVRRRPRKSAFAWAPSATKPSRSRFSTRSKAIFDGCEAEV